MATKYQEFKQLNLPAIEQAVLAKWAAEAAFEQSVALRQGATPFVFYEGPPSANGMPGIHHVISRTLKDLVCRYKTMQGFQVSRKGGWDTHGLPIELGVEKELGITKEDIGKTISVEAYNEKCREAVLRFKDKWDDLTRKMGYWVDLEQPYITYENNYIESVWWLLKKMYDKSDEQGRPLLYESISIQPYSPAAGTGLSSHELNQPGTYKMVKDTSVTAMFKIDLSSVAKKIFQENLNLSDKEALSKISNDETYFLAWTTTPWTLPSNLALTVGPRVTYSLFRTYNPYTFKACHIIIASELSSRYLLNVDTQIEGLFNPFTDVGLLITCWVKWGNEFIWDLYLSGGSSKEELSYQLSKISRLPFAKEIATFEGSLLEGLKYEQLLSYEANSVQEIERLSPGAMPFQVIVADFVTTQDGTGIVHTAPAFGADDYKVGQKYNIGILTMVDRQGRFVDGLGEFSGRYVKNYTDDKNYVDVNVDLSVKLKLENRAFKVEKYEHSYPHCWRTDKPILYYPLDAWFIRTTALKDRMVALNKTIRWKPESTGTGRFGNWLENMVDWNLSRSRFWGTPLPIWKTYHGKPESSNLGLGGSLYEICVGSVSELNVCKKQYDSGVALFFGYLIDLKSITRELSSKAGITENILKFNQNLSNSGDDLALATQRVLLEFLQEKAEKGEISPIALAQAGLTRDLLEPYLTKIETKHLKAIDLHKPTVDEIVFFKENSQNLLYRVPDLIDVWFDSGAMPYAQWHFPFENKDIFAQNYPADFIAEGVDQTRGWFYTLHAIGSLIKEDVEAELQAAGLPVPQTGGLAYKTVVSNGLVLDKNGNKMSKRLGNVVDPFSTIETYGADATRWYLITNASPWDNLKFDIKGIEEVQRKYFGTLYNTYQFFALYANVDGFAFTEAYIPLSERPEIDRWILSSLNSLIRDVTAAMDDYEPTQAGRLLEAFVDEHLSNWYVRLCRRRFWRGDYEQDKICAYQTLFECLETVVLLMAPISPFFADAVFGNLNAVCKRHNVASVHHAKYPVANTAAIDVALEERMQMAQVASSLVLSLRKKEKIKVRQPLQKVLIPVLNPSMAQQLALVEDLVLAEVNVKQMEYLTDTEGFIKKKAKPNFIALGKRLGAKMKPVGAAIMALSQASIAQIEHQGALSLVVDGEELQLSLADVDITAEDIPGWSVATKGSLTVALDLTITPQLQSEGDARELVNRIQTLRKEAGFLVTDRIVVAWSGDEKMHHAFQAHRSYICAEILADDLVWQPEKTFGTQIEVNDIPLTLQITKKEA